MVPTECVRRIRDADLACREAGELLQRLGVIGGEIQELTDLAPYLVITRSADQTDEIWPEVHFCVPAGHVPESVMRTVSGFPPILWYRVAKYPNTFLFVSSGFLGQNLEKVKIVQSGELGEALLPVTNGPVNIDLGKKRERPPGRGAASVPVPGGRLRVDVWRYFPNGLAGMVRDAWEISGQGNETYPSEMYFG